MSKKGSPEEDKKQIEEVTKQVQEAYKKLSDEPEPSSFTFDFSNIIGFRPCTKDLEKEFHQMFLDELEKFMTTKIEKSFEGEIEDYFKTFNISWRFTSLVYNWMDKTYRKTPLIWRPPPHQVVQPTFAKKVCDKPEVIKGLSIFITKTLDEHFKDKPLKTEKKETVDTEKMEVEEDDEIVELPEDVEKILDVFQQVDKKSLEFEIKEEYKQLLNKYFEKLIEKNTSYYGSRYADHYPEDDTTHQENALFYKGLKASQTEGGKIKKVHQDFWGDYDMLEARHNYIQWLFPIREAGMASVQPMTKNEAEQFKKSPEMQANLIKSYEVMLDFYGFVLKNKETGEIGRSDNYKSRFRNLSYHSHNYLRITRILKCLGICGLEHMKKPFLEQFIIEVFQNEELEEVKSSLIRYWLPTLRYEKDLIEMENLIKKLSGKRVCRKVFDSEERTWANVCFPVDTTKSYGNGKTFYNRDDNEDENAPDVIQTGRSCLLM